MSTNAVAPAGGEGDASKVMGAPLHVHSMVSAVIGILVLYNGIQFMQTGFSFLASFMPSLYIVGILGVVCLAMGICIAVFVIKGYMADKTW